MSFSVKGIIFLLLKLIYGTFSKKTFISMLITFITGAIVWSIFGTGIWALRTRDWVVFFK